MSFTEDLKKGEETQIEFVKKLLDLKGINIINIEIAKGKFKDWDIKVDSIPDGEETYEVKSDTKASETGNFVIETRYNGVASGIYASKADYIVYYIKGEWRCQTRGELILRLIDTEKRLTKGGDGYKSEMYVIKCEELPNLFYKIE